MSGLEVVLFTIGVVALVFAVGFYLSSRVSERQAAEEGAAMSDDTRFDTTHQI